MSFSIIGTIPEAINIACLCYKCGLQGIDMKSLVSHRCLCFYENCGVGDLMTTQLCCIGPCNLNSPSLNTTTAIPKALVINCLCFEVGIKEFPNIKSEPFITSACLCLHSSCGLDSIFAYAQFFCLRVDCK